MTKEMNSKCRLREFGFGFGVAGYDFSHALQLPWTLTFCNCDATRPIGSMPS